MDRSGRRRRGRRSALGQAAVNLPGRPQSAGPRRRHEGADAGPARRWRRPSLNDRCRGLPAGVAVIDARSRLRPFWRPRGRGGAVGRPDRRGQLPDGGALLEAVRWGPGRPAWVARAAPF